MSKHAIEPKVRKLPLTLTREEADALLAALPQKPEWRGTLFRVKERIVSIASQLTDTPLEMAKLNPELRGQLRNEGLLPPAERIIDDPTLRGGLG